jgi:hypothetical protein
VQGTLPTDLTQHAAVQAWVDFNIAYADATATANPDLPDWKNRMSASLYAQLRPGLVAGAQSGYVQRGPIVLKPRVAAPLPGNITIDDCSDLSQYQVYDKSGKVVPGANPYVAKNVPFTAILVQQNGAWIVTSMTVGTVGQCA